MLILICGSYADDKMNITNINNYSGIYFKQAGNIRCYNEVYRFGITVDTVELAQKVHNLQEQTLSICKLVTYAANSRSPLKPRCNKLKDNVNELNEEFNYFFKNNKNKKTKRGIIDAGGVFLKWTFGIMNNNDRSKIMSDISNLYKNQNEIRHFQKESVSFIKSFIDDYSNFKNFTTNTITLLSQVVEKNGNELAEINNQFNLMVLLDTITENYNELKLKINTFYNSILMEKLNPEIVKASKLRCLLKDIKISLPNSRYLPFEDNDLAHYYSIY